MRRTTSALAAFLMCAGARAQMEGVPAAIAAFATSLAVHEASHAAVAEAVGGDFTGFDALRNGNIGYTMWRSDSSEQNVAILAAPYAAEFALMSACRRQQAEAGGTSSDYVRYLGLFAMLNMPLKLAESYFQEENDFNSLEEEGGPEKEWFLAATALQTYLYVNPEMCPALELAPFRDGLAIAWRRRF